MAFPASVCRAVFQFSLANGTAGYVTPHLKQSDGSDYSQAELDGLVVQLKEWATVDNYSSFTCNSLMSLLSDQVTLVSITATSLDVATPLQAVISVDDDGVATSAPLPNESCLVTTWYTGIVGRSYRGRNFWPGLATGQMQDNGTLLDTTTSAFQDTFEALLGGIAAETNSEMCVYSPTLPAATTCTTVIVRDVVHHQRRRNS